MAKIAIDLHGGDFGPSVTIPSSLEFFREHPEHLGVLIGDSRQFKRYVANPPQNIEWIEADLIGELAQKPSRLLRQNGHSSIEVCFKALANQDVDSLVSAEHTGVLLALMTKYGSIHSALNRPVLASWIPTLKKQTILLDLGASFSATTDQLLAFASIGAGIAKASIEKPSVGLLNVGTEEFKGPTELKSADRVLKAWSHIDYLGFLEANQVFTGELDVIVCDGFTGNSIIKSSEGALDLAFKTLREKLNGNLFTRVLGTWLAFEMKGALKPLDPKLANGALIAGSDLLAIKSHGNAQHRAFKAAIKKAADLALGGVIGSIWDELDNINEAEDIAL